jgi:ubiquinone/menaquinone biosynthesis C-methylase UbiE
LIAGVFGRAAPTYERAGPPFFGAVASRLVAFADLPAGACVLDVATGTGAALVEAARRAGPAGMAVGVDLAEPMVGEARRRLREAGVGNAAVLVMDAEALGFRAGVFDAVLCASAIYLLPHPVQALRGFRRVLRRGLTSRNQDRRSSGAAAPGPHPGLRRSVVMSGLSEADPEVARGRRGSRAWASTATSPSQ